MLELLKLKNFKCFKNQTVEFGNLTVFAGANGVGKSSAIQALLLVREAIEQTRKNFFAVNRRQTLQVALNNNFCLCLGSANEVLNSNAEDDEILFELSSNDHSVKFILEARDNELSLILRGIEHPAGSRVGLPIFSKEFHYLTAERVGPRNIQNVVDQPYISTGWQGELTGQAIEKAGNQKRVLEKTDPRVFVDDIETIYTLRNQIEKWMDFIIPNVRINIDSFPQINTVRVSLKNTTSKTAFLNPNNIGFGITYVLPIVASGLIAGRDSMLIVENPEAHLHPSGQSRVGQFLARIASAGVQVVIETHSEHVINGIRLAVLKDVISPEKIKLNFISQLTSSSGPTLEAIGVTRKGDLTRWPLNFFDQEETDLAEIFRLRKQ